MLTNEMSMAKTQDDLIAEQTEAKPECIVEDIQVPALKYIHTFTTDGLIEFFNTVVKIRPGIRTIDFTLGDNYITKDVPSRIPNSNNIHSLSRDNIAKVLAMALSSDAKVVGFNVNVTQDQTGILRTTMMLKMGSITPKGPTYDERGNMTALGDKEFAPKLRLTSSPI